MALDQALADAIRGHFGETKEQVIVATIPNFLEGSLQIIRFADASGKSYETSYYSSNTSSEFFPDVERLSDFVANRKARLAFSQYFLQWVGFSGVLALVIVIGIIVLWIWTKNPPPEFLTNAFTLVLGYYFGSGAKK